MPSLYQAIIEAFRSLGGERIIEEISNWVSEKYADNGKISVQRWQIWCHFQMVGANCHLYLRNTGTCEEFQGI
jgi:hypothetical protein